MNLVSRWLIAGLGNPGEKYRITPHNAGFLFAEYVAERNNFSINVHKNKPWAAGVFQLGLSLAGQEKNVEINLVKPLTFMNRSGEAVTQFLKNENIALDHLVVVHDEVDLPPGTHNVKQGGGHRGQNGVRDIMNRMGTGEFTRIRIGVGRPDDPGLADYLLTPAPKIIQEMQVCFPEVYQSLLAVIEEKELSAP